MVTVRSPDASPDGTGGLGANRVVSIFVAERDTAGATTAFIGEVHRALDAAARRVTEPNRPVRYLRTFYLPGEQRCICVFQACDAGIVELVNDTAQVPFGRVVEAIQFLVESPTLGAEP